MPFHFDASSGDGAAPGISGDGASAPIATPGELVITAYVPACEVPPGPPLPLVLSRVAAGFPSPADDYVEGHLDLHELTGALSPSCYFMRADGESMTGAGIFSGDVLSSTARSSRTTGDVVVAGVDGELTVKRFVRAGEGGRRCWRPNPKYPAIESARGRTWWCGAW